MSEHRDRAGASPTDRACDRDFVATAFVVQDSRVLLVKHKKLRMWLPPGGHIERNELPDEAVVREVREETGLEVALFPPAEPGGDGVRKLHHPFMVQLEDIYPGHQHIDLIYLAAPTGGTMKLATAEAEELRWFDGEALGAPDIQAEVRDSGRRAINAMLRYVETAFHTQSGTHGKL